MKWLCISIIPACDRNGYFCDGYVLVCEQCIQRLHQNDVIFLCKDCVSIL
jgi:hypothetical protein